MEQQNEESKIEEPSQNLSFWRVVLSVIQASFGVQSQQNRERDFTQGKLITFIVAALIFTSLFVGILLFIVKTVLDSSGD